VSVTNPYPETLTGEASWLVDASVFSVEPSKVGLRIPPGALEQFEFKLRALQDAATLQSLPRLEFSVISGGARHRFNREVRFVQEITTPYRKPAPVVDGELADWAGVPALKLGEGAGAEVELRTCHDRKNLFLALTLPSFEAEEVKEMGFSDEVQVGMARRLSATDFGGDLLRLGFNSGTLEAVDRTPGHRRNQALSGTQCVSRVQGRRTHYEISVPLKLLREVRAGSSERLVLDLSFPLAQSESASGESKEPTEPKVNTFSYRVRYGSDSLVPVYFVELDLLSKR
jgi:hypothetical protein